MITIAVVADSLKVQEILRRLLADAEGIQVMRWLTTRDDIQALLREDCPQVLLVAASLPQLQELNLAKSIMETVPLPIMVVCEAGKLPVVHEKAEALNPGILEIRELPNLGDNGASQEDGADLIHLLKLISGVKVIRRSGSRSRAEHASVGSPASADFTKPCADKRIVAIGVSTGGPAVLRTILAGLPEDFSAPILVVQHIMPDFLPFFVEWLQAATALTVCVATQRLPLQAGHVYFAPDGLHLGVDRASCVQLSGEAPDDGLRPSITHLFRSVAQVYGSRAVGILLTGMGRDGAAALQVLREVGGTTIAQDKASSVVHGMPGEAIKLGAAMHVLSPERIILMLRRLFPGRTDISSHMESVSHCDEVIT